MSAESKTLLYGYDAIEALGVDRLDSTEADKLDLQFFATAQQAFMSAGVSAHEFLAANPGVSECQLAKTLNRRANGIGILMASYSESQRMGTVRDTAKDFLIRQILSEFPDGWKNGTNVSPIVRLSGWCFAIRNYVKNREFVRRAEAIAQAIAIENPPREGWKPRVADDPFIESLFERLWPI